MILLQVLALLLLLFLVSFYSELDITNPAQGKQTINGQFGLPLHEFCHKSNRELHRPQQCKSRLKNRISQFAACLHPSKSASRITAAKAAPDEICHAAEDAREDAEAITTARHCIFSPATHTDSYAHPQ